MIKMMNRRWNSTQVFMNTVEQSTRRSHWIFKATIRGLAVGLCTAWSRWLTLWQFFTGGGWLDLPGSSSHYIVFDYMSNLVIQQFGFWVSKMRTSAAAAPLVVLNLTTNLSAECLIMASATGPPVDCINSPSTRNINQAGRCSAEKICRQNLLFLNDRYLNTKSK